MADFNFNVNRKKFTPNSENIARNLDIKDGKKDKQISASVWNTFVKDKGGKKIKNSISLENARKSIETYLARNSKLTGKDKDTLATEWLLQLFGTSAKSKLPASNEVKLNDDILNKYFPKQTPKEKANSLCKFIKGESESYILPNKKEAAQVVQEMSKNFKGRIPLTLGSHLLGGGIYSRLLERANELGIKTNYKKDTNFGKDNMHEICKNRWKACIDLKNKILQAEKNNKTN